MKESHQLNVAYQALIEKYGATIIVEVSGNISDKVVYDDDKHNGEYLYFEMGYEFAKKLKPRQKAYVVFTEDLAYIFKCYRVSDVIKKFKHELRNEVPTICGPTMKR
jgi:hypothetical protein